MLSEMLRKFTDNYLKTPLSNLGKLISIVAKKLTEIRSTAEKVDRWHSVDEAEGTTLDLIGDEVGQLRSGAWDNAYRILIKAKRACNESTADVNTIIRALSAMINCDYQEVHVVEVEDDGAREPASIAHIEIPLDELKMANIADEEIMEVIKSVVAGGVSVKDVWLNGSFMLSSIYNQSEIDAAHGLSDLDQITGGTLGGKYEEADADYGAFALSSFYAHSEFSKYGLADVNRTTGGYLEQ